LSAALTRFQEVEQSLSEASTMRDPSRMAELGREHSRLAPISEAAARLYKLDEGHAPGRGLGYVF
jgi:protein subunit release factor A